MNRKIVLFSFLWMFGIVLFHSSGGESPRWYTELMSDFRIGGVSFFFAVSGFFLMKHYGENGVLDWWKCEVSKRIFSLGVPYLIWCTLGLTSSDLLHQFGILGIGPTANAPLWYVKFLLIFCVLSPIVVVLMKYIPRKLFVPFAIIAILILPWLHLPMKFSLFLSLLMFGIGAALHRDSISGLSLKYPLAILPLFWIGLYALRLTGIAPEVADWPLKSYCAVTLVAISISAISYISDIPSLPKICGTTFFVYCSHGLFLRYVHPFSSVQGAGGFLNGVFAFVLCLAIGEIMRRYFSPCYRVLTGNR